MVGMKLRQTVERRKDGRQTFRPGGGARGIGDQVLADLYQRMRNPGAMQCRYMVSPRSAPS